MDKVGADNSEVMIVDGEKKRRIVGYIDDSEQVLLSFYEVKSKRFRNVLPNGTRITFRYITDTTQEDGLVDFLFVVSDRTYMVLMMWISIYTVASRICVTYSSH